MSLNATAENPRKMDALMLDADNALLQPSICGQRKRECA